VSCGQKDSEIQKLTTLESEVENHATTGRPALTSETYSSEAINILERHKLRLQSVLPNIILSEVEVYKKTLVEMEKKTALSYSLDETYILSEKIREKSGYSILQEEVDLNVSYFELFNELSLLNAKYETVLDLKNNNLIDFYDAGPIALSDEVLLKVEELTKDEDERLRQEKKEDYKNYVFNVLDAIPVKGKMLSFLIGVTKAAKAFKAGKMLASNSGMLSQYSYKIMNKDVAGFVAKHCKNEVMREAIATRVGKVAVSKHAQKIPFNYLTLNKQKAAFKNIENKINGRIGDFSDGILAVHLQRVRDIIKANAIQLKGFPTSLNKNPL
jgi:hypothetical protein